MDTGFLYAFFSKIGQKNGTEFGVILLKIPWYVLAFGCPCMGLHTQRRRLRFTTPIYSHMLLMDDEAIRARGVSMGNQRQYVTIHCVSPFYLGRCFEIVVFNKDNCPVFHGKTGQDGTSSFAICLPGEYCIRVRAQSCLSPRAATRWLFLQPNRSYSVYFLFSACCFKSSFTTVKFRLTDQNYVGLPIQKGDIRLCRVPM